MRTLIITLLACAWPVLPASAEVVNASSVLAQYRKNQDNVRSFVATGETIDEISDTANAQLKFRREISTVQSDGDRFSCEMQTWRSTTRDELFSSLANGERAFSWNGKTYTEYLGADKPDNRRAYVRNNDEMKNEMVTNAYTGAPLLGVLWGDLERVDSILDKANVIKVRDETEQVGGAACYVVEAATKNGQYKVWIDPEHGYNIVRAEGQKGAQDEAWGKPLDWKGGKKLPEWQYKPGAAKEQCSFLMENIRLQKVGDSWVPMEADMEQRLVFADGRVTTTKRKHKRTAINTSPDFSAEDAFALHIPDGTRAFIEGVDALQMQWKNGRPAPLIDEEAVAKISKQARSHSEVKASAELVSKNDDHSAAPGWSGGSKGLPIATGLERRASIVWVGSGILVLGVMVVGWVGLRNQKRRHT